MASAQLRLSGLIETRSMKRTLEPELMEDEAQVKAYAEADFEEPNSLFMALFQEMFPLSDIQGYVLDLGCGPGDIGLRFARAYPSCIVHGVDGSSCMVRYAQILSDRLPDIKERVRFICGRLPEVALPRTEYEVIISNSLLHHLPDPQTLWRTVKDYGAPGTAVLVMDLQRPSSTAAARSLVERYAADEPELLRRDFYNSLLAAFELEEIKAQLQKAGLSYLSAQAVSDRHVAVNGYLR